MTSPAAAVKQRCSTSVAIPAVVDTVTFIHEDMGVWLVVFLTVDVVVQLQLVAVS